MPSPPVVPESLLVLDHSLVAAELEGHLADHVDDWTHHMLAVEVSDYALIQVTREALFKLGKAEQQAVWQLNDRFKHPLQNLMQDAQGGGQMMRLLHEVQQKIMQLKPPQKSFLSSFKNMFKLMFSWHDSAWSAWLEGFPEHKKALTHVVAQLQQQQRRLGRDNTMLSGDKKDMELALEQLKNSYDLACLLEQQVQSKLQRDKGLNAENVELVQDEFIPVIQQRIIELQQQLLMARQAVMTIELIMSQNETQIREAQQAAQTALTVVDVTAGVVLLANKKNNNQKAVKAQQIKQVRQVIDQASEQMDELSAELANVTAKLAVEQDKET